MKVNYNRIYLLIVFDDDDKIISVCEFVFFNAFYRTIDRLVALEKEYDYKDEYIDYDKGCLCVSIKKKNNYVHGA